MGSSIFYPDVAPDYANNQPYRTETQRNIPENAVALKEGAWVVTADGQHVGSVKRVFTQSKNDKATHFLISEGVFFKDHKMVPIDWVDEIKEDAVYLNVTADMLKGLPEFQETA